MMKIGMIGMNEGNGHPYSYSAMFNGYDERALVELCPFDLIKSYLPEFHRNKNFIEGAKVTHIWTQDSKLSRDIAAVSLIPNIVNNFEDLIGKVDAVILARDDPWEHLTIAKPFLERGIPIFIDKQLVSKFEDFKELLHLTGPRYPMMSGSPARYTRELQEAFINLNKNDVRSIHGISRVTWMRYGHHLLEGIIRIWGTNISNVRSISIRPNHDIIQFQYLDGPLVILEFIDDVALPIQFTCFSNNQAAYSIPFTDYFFSFKAMLSKFIEFVNTGKRDQSYEEMIFISKLVLAGDMSKNLGGKFIEPNLLKPMGS
jgi:hypothetical protein